jgi:hypothetical protein
MSYNYPDLIEFWNGVLHDTKEWYKTADSKAAGVITINTIMLTVTTFGLNFFHNESNRITIMFSILFWCFLGTILSSVILSVIALWARIKIQYTGPHSPDVPDIFFSYIANKYPTNEDTVSEQGIKFFIQEIKQKPFSDNAILKAVAREIVILSSNVNKKYLLTNFSYVLIIVSMGLLIGIIAMEAIK